MALRSLSCFTGGYGLELGLEIGFPGMLEPVLYVEGEITAAGFLAALVEAGLIPQAPVWSDVRTLGDATVRSYLRQYARKHTIRGGVQAITAGYPCPDFSTAGKQQGFKGEKGKLWFALRDAIRLYRPDVAFLENVGGHLRRGFQRVRRELREMGYSVAAGLFTAEEVGCSQKRERLFILARRKGSYGEVLLRGWGSREAGGESGREGEQLACRSKRQLGNELRRCGWTCRARTPEPRRQGEELARSVRNGWGQGAPSSSRPKRQSSAVGEGLPELPLFPPGPDSLADWEDVLEVAGWLAPAVGKATEPALCRLAHGLARMDVLRILGNGVVPLQVAYAFRTLAASVGLRKDEGEAVV